MKKPFRNKVTTRSKTVLINEFKNIVGVANIRRLVLFDAMNSETTLTDKSTNKQNATLSLPAGSLNQAISGKAKVLNFNAAGDYWDFVDADDLSFGDGTTDSKLSFIICGKPNDVSNSTILAKSDLTTGSLKREYSLLFSSNPLYMNFNDNSASAQRSRITGNLSTDTSSYHSYIATYNGSGNPLTGAIIYRDSVRADVSQFTTGTYTAMENLTSKVGNYYIDASGNKTAVGSFNYAFLAIISDELSQTQVTAIDTLLRRYVGVI